jgi:16S rRNA G966 N2-methylase RsmD
MKPIRHHMQHFYAVKNYKNVSVLSLWTRVNLEKALRFNRQYHSTPYVSEIIRSLSFTNGLGKITIYRPLLAKTIVTYFKAKSVLDVCVGWGGRMLGALSSATDVHYTGIEPCKKTYEGLINIIADVSTVDKKLAERATLIHDTAENALSEMSVDTKFDLAITSPPYYNLEIYSDEATQSLSYGDYQSWLDNFLEPVIRETLKRVNVSCWSVKNFKTDKKYNLLADVIKIHEKYEWKMLNVTFSMTNSKRPGAATVDTNKLSEETTYVFAKR